MVLIYFQIGCTYQIRKVEIHCCYSTAYNQVELTSLEYHTGFCHYIPTLTKSRNWITLENFLRFLKRHIFYEQLWMKLYLNDEKGHHYILRGLKNLCGMHLCTLYFWQCSDACQFGPKRNSSSIQTWLENKDTKMSFSNPSWLK